MPTWGALAWGIAASGLLALLGVRFPPPRTAIRCPGYVAAAALLAPLLWDLILRHTGGRFFVDAPVTGSQSATKTPAQRVFATALAALVLGLGPLRADSGRRVALTSLIWASRPCLWTSTSTERKELRREMDHA
jgi:hypothetical protein